MLLAHPHIHRAFEQAERELQALEASDFSADLIKEIQAHKLARVWQRARKIPYYKELLATNPRFEDLPVTPKSVVKNEPERFWPQGEALRPIKYYETSGTTGLPTQTPRLGEDIVWNTLSVASMWKRVLAPEERVSSLLPSDVSPIGDLISNVCEYLNLCLVRAYPYALGICDWERLEQIFQRYRPTCIFAAPGVMLQFMRVLKQRGSFLRVRESVGKIMLLGEVATPALRASLGRNWEAEVIDASYGSTETGTIAAAADGRGLRLLHQSFIAEIATSVGIAPAQPGISGELIVTPLNNHARSLLRYSTGDLVEVQDMADGLLSLKVLGRKEEVLVIGEVVLDVDTAERIIYAVPNITGYMIELEADGCKARLLLERDADFTSKDECKITLLRQEFTQIGIEWTGIVLVNQLPQVTKSGAGLKNWKRSNVRVVQYA
jgi:phenylacetate-CoA ligase